ncbi:DUF6327 family protein [Flavimarina sp. Hel_I_48]|uniref:DUF6327 family protein n=1 Tax=Flavimarina sp. Hel_I_48 TaxID=1392488 RepID=UPI0004DF58C1|nr:DUF6327 family protein [Flavimarina sp. Hel_I_48]
MKVYSSFEQIEHDLKILKLQQQIDKEQLKADVNDMKSNFNPVGSIANTVGAIVKKAFVYKAVDKLVGIKKVKNKNYE